MDKPALIRPCISHTILSRPQKTTHTRFNFGTGTERAEATTSASRPVVAGENAWHAYHLLINITIYPLLIPTLYFLNIFFFFFVITFQNRYSHSLYYCKLFMQYSHLCERFIIIISNQRRQPRAVCFGRDCPYPMLHAITAWRRNT